MGSHLHQRFDTCGHWLEPLLGLLVGLGAEPVRGPADEVSGESGKLSRVHYEIAGEVRFKGRGARREIERR